MSIHELTEEGKKQFRRRHLKQVIRSVTAVGNSSTF